MKLYHGAKLSDIKILKPAYGRFGTAVYLAKNPDYALKYGHLVATTVYDKPIRKIVYESLVEYAP